MEFKYDVAVSFAGEDREYVKEVVSILTDQRNVSVFYDENFQHELWGEDLAVYLARVYSKESKYCIPFISTYYAEKMWTRHEIKNAFERAIQEKKAYILPAYFDETRIDGLPITTGHIDLKKNNPTAVANLILKKLGYEIVEQPTANLAVKPLLKSSAALPIFNNIDLLREELSKVGIGELRPWIDYDELDLWGCSSNYYEIETPSYTSTGSSYQIGTRIYMSINTGKNNLAMYLESSQPCFAQRLKIVLNLNNPRTEETARVVFAEAINKVFDHLSLLIPIGLLNCIQRGREFKADSGTFSVKHNLEISNVDTWKVVIESY